MVQYLITKKKKIVYSIFCNLFISCSLYVEDKTYKNLLDTIRFGPREGEKMKKKYSNEWGMEKKLMYMEWRFKACLESVEKQFKL